MPKIIYKDGLEEKVGIDWLYNNLEMLDSGTVKYIKDKPGHIVAENSETRLNVYDSLSLGQKDSIRKGFKKLEKTPDGWSLIDCDHKVTETIKVTLPQTKDNRKEEVYNWIKQWYKEIAEDTGIDESFIIKLLENKLV